MLTTRIPIIKSIAKEYLHILHKHQNDYTKFIILSRSRTGSTYLDHLLRSHRNTKVFGEVFNEYRATKYRNIQLDPIMYLNKKIFKKKNSNQ